MSLYSPGHVCLHLLFINFYAAHLNSQRTQALIPHYLQLLRYKWLWHCLMCNPSHTGRCPIWKLCPFVNIRATSNSFLGNHLAWFNLKKHNELFNIQVEIFQIIYDFSCKRGWIQKWRPVIKLNDTEAVRQPRLWYSDGNADSTGEFSRKISCCFCPTRKKTKYSISRPSCTHERRGGGEEEEAGRSEGASVSVWLSPVLFDVAWHCQQLVSHQAWLTLQLKRASEACRGVCLGQLVHSKPRCEFTVR